MSPHAFHGPCLSINISRQNHHQCKHNSFHMHHNERKEISACFLFACRRVDLYIFSLMGFLTISPRSLSSTTSHQPTSWERNVFLYGRKWVSRYHHPRHGDFSCRREPHTRRRRKLAGYLSISPRISHVWQLDKLSAAWGFSLSFWEKWLRNGNLLIKREEKARHHHEERQGRVRIRYLFCMRRI